ncbi:MAG: type IV pilus assembly protein PilM [Planctomycetota bacterium]|nr:MAG: type IV pilus assembly protein PilM [Planctomycetota bacterium]
MAGNVIWGVDLGKSSLKAVKMQLFKTGLEIQEIAHLVYEVDLDNEEAVQEAMASALGDFVNDYLLKGEHVAVALPGRSAFSRFIKIPHVDPKSIDSIIRHEARQHIPFPIEDVVWSYHALESRQAEEDEEMEVGIFAVKKDLVQGYLSDLSVHSIDPDLMTIAPLALYNFLSYDMDLSKKTTLVLEMGADHTDLVIVDRGRFWLRNLPIAGRDFTAAIQKKLKLSFQDAEKLKCNLSKSKHAKKVLKVLQPLFKDLADETHRSMGFYKSQASDVKFHNILLLGGGAKIYTLKKVLEKELRLPVKRLTRFSRTNIAAHLDVSVLKQNIESFGIAIGLAVQGLEQSKANVNLLPEEKIKAKENVKKRPYVLGACAVMFVMIVILGMMKSSSLQKIESIGEGLKAYQGQTPMEYLKRSKRAVLAASNMVPIQTALQGLVEVGRYKWKPLEVLGKINTIFRNNAKIKFKQPQEEKKPSFSEREAVIKAIKKGDKKRVWMLSFRLTNDMHLDSPKGGIQVEMVSAVALKGNEFNTKRGPVEQMVEGPIKSYFQESFVRDGQGNPQMEHLFLKKPYVLALEGEGIEQADIIVDDVFDEKNPPTQFYIFSLKFSLKRDQPLVKVEKPAFGAKKKKRRGRRRGRH